MPQNPRRWIKEQIKIWNFKSIGITRESCLRLSEMPYYHEDAVDRMLVATALDQEMSLLSNNEEIQKYPISIIW
jgi:PIN domain nuclease of toxin-antitoxin system